MSNRTLDHECDCGEECSEISSENSFSCRECEQSVLVCECCRVIVRGCNCGLCEEGSTFQESD